MSLRHPRTASALGLGTLLLTAGAVIATPGTALASAGQCDGQTVYGSSYAQCIDVNGGGKTVNYVNAKIDLTPNSNDAFPSYSGCTVNVHVFYKRVAPYNDTYTKTQGPISCAGYTGSTFTQFHDVADGEMCMYMDFNAGAKTRYTCISITG